MSLLMLALMLAGRPFHLCAPLKANAFFPNSVHLRDFNRKAAWWHAGGYSHLDGGRQGCDQRHFGTQP